LRNKPHVIASDDVESTVFNLYEKREKIYTRKIEGFYQNIRLFTGWPLLIGYFISPWLMVEGRQAILFDLPERKFHIFWLTFWPQDFVLLAWALVMAAFLLFFVTTLFGRVWCGYTCPQTVWTAVFMWAEQLTEGDRNARMKLDGAPMSLEKAWRKTSKHAMWFGFALLTGMTFVAYFYGMRNLLVDGFNLQLPFVTAFWTLFFSFATYANAGWMREQVCIYMCPYARFQSAMFDRDTLIVSYDEARGEPRGSRKRSAEPASLGLGDCVSCNACVHVCPTGIDIRDGLQYQCINCAHCIDACDEVMGKMGYATGLVSYTTSNALEGKPWTWKRLKLVGYGLALIAMMVAFIAVLATRIPLELDVIRDRGQLFQELPGGRIQNSYTLKIINMDTQPRTFNIRVLGLKEAQIIPAASVQLMGSEIGDVGLVVVSDPDLLTEVNTDIEFIVDSTDGELSASSESRFIGPIPAGDLR